MVFTFQMEHFLIDTFWIRDVALMVDCHASFEELTAWIGSEDRAPILLRYITLPGTRSSATLTVYHFACKSLHCLARYHTGLSQIRHTALITLATTGIFLLHTVQAKPFNFFFHHLDDGLYLARDD